MELKWARTKWNFVLNGRLFLMSKLYSCLATFHNTEPKKRHDTKNNLFRTRKTVCHRRQNAGCDAAWFGGAWPFDADAAFFDSSCDVSEWVSDAAPSAEPSDRGVSTWKWPLAFERWQTAPKTIGLRRGLRSNCWCRTHRMNCPYRC